LGPSSTGLTHQAYIGYDIITRRICVAGCQTKIEFVLYDLALRVIKGNLDGSLVLAAYDATMKGLGKRAHHLDGVNNCGASFCAALRGLEETRDL